MLLNNGFFLPRIITVTYMKIEHEINDTKPMITLTIRIGADNQKSNL